MAIGRPECNCLNFDYLISFKGSAKLLQFVVGLIVMSIMAYYFNNVYYTTGTVPIHGHEKTGVYVLLVATTCTITTFLLLLSSIISESTGRLLSSTLFESVYHLTACFLNVSAGIAFLVQIDEQKLSIKLISTADYNGQMAAAVMTLLNAGFYLFATVLSYIAYRNRP